MLGHLTGRMLLQREAYPFDFERVAAEAAARGVWLEINASPERLDLHGSTAADRESQRVPVHDLDRRPSSQASAQHAVRRGDGAPRLADAGT